MDFTNLKGFLDHMAQEITPGNAIVVYKGNEKIYEYASGYSNLEEKVPMTGKEMFNIYSCSKITTVTAGMQLLERGKILLSDPLYEYIPEFKKMTARTITGELTRARRPITLENLFTMTAGFFYDYDTPGFKKAREVTNGHMDTVETMRCIAEDPLWFSPGEKWQYSICHDVLAAVVSIVSGQKFRDYVKENIFDPLGMKDITYHPTEETLKRTADQYLYVVNGKHNHDLVNAKKRGKEGHFENIGKSVGYDIPFILGDEYDSGGAGIITTPDEYVKLLDALANRGVGATGEKILSPAAIDLMRRPHLTDTQKPYFNWNQLKGYGYGLGVYTHVDPALSNLLSSTGEFGWFGAAGAAAIMDANLGMSAFYVQHVLNPSEDYYITRLRNALYSCMD